MRSVLLLTLCVSIAIMPGCSTSRSANLRNECSAGSRVACEELSHAQTSEYQEQNEAGLEQSRPLLPSAATAVPPGNHFP
jgi:hypothetical protein